MIKVGDFVYSKLDKSTGVVVHIDDWSKTEPYEPLSDSNHGSIEIRITDIGDSTYLTVHDIEHYVLFDWQDSLIIKEQK